MFTGLACWGVGPRREVGGWGGLTLPSHRMSRALEVCPAGPGSLKLLSRASGSCKSSSSSSAGRRTPSQRGSAAGSQTPVAGETHTRTQTHAHSVNVTGCGWKEVEKRRSVSIPKISSISRHLIISHLRFHLFILHPSDYFSRCNTFSCSLSIRPKTITPSAPPKVICWNFQDD